MKNIFLAPRSDETSYEHFESTILKGRSIDFIKQYLTQEEINLLSGQKVLSI